MFDQQGFVPTDTEALTSIRSNRTLPLSRIYRNTIKSPIHCLGVGVHSGKTIALELKPADAGHGIVFKRLDVGADKNPLIEALYNRVSETTLCTKISNDDGVSVGTIEHLMSAISAMGIDDCLITLDGEEVPILDGSAEPFMHLLGFAGVQPSLQPISLLRILRTVSVTENDKEAYIEPHEGLKASVTIDFPATIVGHQMISMDISEYNFSKHIARARTFGFLREVETMRKAGLAKGGSLKNAVVIGDNRVLNDEGLRFPDEFVRHKLLDLIGDVALAGMPVLGHIHSHRGGHALSNHLVRTIFSDPRNYEIITSMEYATSLAAE